MEAMLCMITGGFVNEGKGTPCSALQRMQKQHTSQLRGNRDLKRLPCSCGAVHHKTACSRPVGDCHASVQWLAHFQTKGNTFKVLTCWCAGRRLVGAADTTWVWQSKLDD